MASGRYLFFHPEYKARYISEAGPVADICFFTNNMKLGIYLRPSRSQLPIFPYKI